MAPTLRHRPRSALRLERLESRDAPATLVSPTRLTYQDKDGDLVTVAFTRPILVAANVNGIFTFDSGFGAVNGSNAVREQLQKIDLTGSAALATGLGITLTAVRQPGGGDGFAAVGEIDATGINLGTVAVDGDLGRIQAGTVGAVGLAGLTVQSMGQYGTLTGAPDLSSAVLGTLRSLRVRGNMRAEFFASSLGTADVRGSLIGGPGIGSGQISTGLGIGSITVHGDLIGGAGPASGRVASAGRIGTLTIGGSVRGGTVSDTGEINCGGEIGTLRIGGDLVGGSAAGTADLGNTGFVTARRVGRLTIGGSVVAGTNATTGFYRNNGAVRVEDDLGTVLVKGSLVGNPTNAAIISARGQSVPTATTDVAIGSLRVLGRVEFANILAGIDPVDTPMNADAQVGSVFVGGDWVSSSLSAGAGAGADGYFGNGDDIRLSGVGVRDAPTAFARIARVTIGGQILGTVAAGDHYGIVAEDVGSLRIGGTVIPLTAPRHTDDVSVGITGDFEVREV
jgi:hypothetical protein